MRSFIIALVALVVFGSSLSRESSAYPIGEHVTQLPEDWGFWQTVVLLSGNAAADQSLLSGFEREPRLRKLAAQTTFSALPPEHFWVRRWYGSAGRPGVVVMKPGGERVYQATGSNLPSTTVALADEIATAISYAPKGQCGPNCPDGKCPMPPKTPLDPNRRPQFPDLRPDGATPSDDFLIPALWVGVGLLAGGAYLLSRSK